MVICIWCQCKQSWGSLERMTQKHELSFLKLYFTVAMHIYRHKYIYTLYCQIWASWCEFCTKSETSSAENESDPTGRKFWQNSPRRCKLWADFLQRKNLPLCYLFLVPQQSSLHTLTAKAVMNFPHFLTCSFHGFGSSAKVISSQVLLPNGEDIGGQ